MKWFFLLFLLSLSSLAFAEDYLKPETMPGEFSYTVTNKHGLSPRWVLAANKNNTEVYMDLKTISTDYRGKLVWLMAFGPLSKDNKPFQALINCEKRLYGTQPIAPESIQEDLYKSVCTFDEVMSYQKIEPTITSNNNSPPAGFITGDFKITEYPFTERDCIGCSLEVREGWAVKLTHPTEGVWKLPNNCLISGSNLTPGPSVRSFQPKPKKSIW